jgi:hypothetical protein
MPRTGRTGSDFLLTVKQKASSGETSCYMVAISVLEGGENRASRLALAGAVSIR